MGYKTTQHIVDSQDNMQYYRKGSEFPRSGLKVSEDRLKELIKGGFIVVVDDEVTTDFSKLKKDELIELANGRGIEVSTSMTKAEIIEALGV